MKRSYSTAQLSNPIEALRKAGYAYFKDPQSGEESFVLRLSSDYYPRFHLYVEQAEGGSVFNLHLDQKKPSYGDNHMHSGEYDGPTVAKEMQRIDGWVKATAQLANADTSEHDIDHRNKKQQIQQGDMLKRWWKKLFG